VLTGLDERAEADTDFRALLTDALDPYATLRSVYLQDRAGEIAALKGKPIVDEFDTPQDPGAPDAKPAAPSAAPELQDPLADPAAPPPAEPAPKPSDPPSGAGPAAPVQR
jgi:phospholipid-binding lipoprotein MlaA